MFISRIWKNAVEHGGIVSAMLPVNNPAITEVIPLNDYSLLLYYTTGGYRVFDVGPLLNGEAFQKPKNTEIFRNVQLHETVSWCDGKLISHRNPCIWRADRYIVGMLTHWLKAGQRSTWTNTEHVMQKTICAGMVPSVLLCGCKAGNKP